VQAVLDETMGLGADNGCECVGVFVPQDPGASDELAGDRGTRRLDRRRDCLLFWVWRISWPRDTEGTQRLAEDEGRPAYSDFAYMTNLAQPS
jgi:hypothetical protein